MDGFRTVGNAVRAGRFIGPYAVSGVQGVKTKVARRACRGFRTVVGGSTADHYPFDVLRAQHLFQISTHKGTAAVFDYHRLITLRGRKWLYRGTRCF